jgi:hypothetical protein
MMTKKTTRNKSTTDTQSEVTPATTTVAVAEDTNTVELESQIQQLTNQLNTERAKTRQFGTVLGQMRYRITDVLELDPATRTKILTEIDTVFNRAL